MVLPRPFEVAAYTLSRGLPPDLFKYLPPLRHIHINEKMSPLLGVYFSTHLEETPINQPKWRELGWDGKPCMMILPTFDVEEWVLLHEYAHYLDDVFIRPLVTGKVAFSKLSPSKVRKFMTLSRAMHREYNKTRKVIDESMKKYRDAHP